MEARKKVFYESSSDDDDVDLGQIMQFKDIAPNTDE
jgi:hypothetical protein